ncbi:uncharacterized protein LOC131646506 [Vicia villosa]|uniref:uncharacterized protein LOC131646506 n=1 Tax=Vicia villosa TaxID=3911 RepID=UPI00273C20B9|nr:uncharacterized protein LOC131646506 [Vicia villosa]
MEDNDSTQKFSITDEDGSVSIGVGQDIRPSEKIKDIDREIKISKEINPNEYAIVKGKKNSNDVNSNEYDITEEEKNFKEVNLNLRKMEDEDGFVSIGVGQDITPSEKTKDIDRKIKISKEINPNEYAIAEEKKNPNEVNSNEYNLTKEEKNLKEVNIKGYDIDKEKKAMIEPSKFIGRNIYKEFEGVKSFGTVTTYMTFAKLFEVVYKNDNRMEYLDHDDILNHLVKKDKTYEIQLVESSSNKTEMEEVRDGSTSKRKMEDSSINKGKSSSKKEKISSSYYAQNFRENEYEEEIYEPYHFTRHICKEYIIRLQILRSMEKYEYFLPTPSTSDSNDDTGEASASETK